MCAKLHTVAASNNRDHAPQSLLLLVRATYTWVLFFAHIPFVVNRTFNTTSTERLQQKLTIFCAFVSMIASIWTMNKVARRPWAPRTVLEFAIKTRYVLESWKTSCCPWIFSGVLENYWIFLNCSFKNYWLPWTFKNQEWTISMKQSNV